MTANSWRRAGAQPRRRQVITETERQQRKKIATAKNIAFWSLSLCGYFAHLDKQPMRDKNEYTSLDVKLKRLCEFRKDNEERIFCVAGDGLV